MPMEFATFKAQLDAARTFEHQVDGITFNLVLPTEYACRVAIEGNLNEHGHVVGAKSSRAMLDGAVTGWNGCKASHFKPDAGDELVPFSPAARAELLNTRLDIFDQLVLTVARKLDERRERLEASRKN